MFPLIKLAKKLKGFGFGLVVLEPHPVFPLIKLAKKLKDPRKHDNNNTRTWFPLIKLAKKLKENGSSPSERSIRVSIN